MKPKLFVHRIHEHGDEWVFTIGTKLAVGPPRVRPGDAKTAETNVVDRFLDSLVPDTGPHWPY